MPQHAPRLASPFVRSRLLAPVAAAGFAFATLAAPAGRAAPAAPAYAPPAAAAADPGDAAARERAAGRAIERGLNWLAAETEKGAAGKEEGAAGGAVQTHVAFASLAGLAFLQDGAEPGKGRYGPALRQCIDYVAARADPKTGLIADAGAGPMYGHGHATFFLAEAFARTGDDALKPKVAAAVRLIEKTQNAEGGWRYQPAPYDADVSVTCCQLVALRAAQRAGVEVDQKVIDNALRYVRSCQKDDGGFVYMPNAGGTGVARSAAAVAAMTHCGVRGAGYDKAVAYLARLAGTDRAAGAAADPHFYYAHYYLGHALPAAPAEARGPLYAALRDRLVARQNDPGTWKGDFSDAYATASAVFALQTPDSRLNLFKPENAGQGGASKGEAGGGGGARDK